MKLGSLIYEVVRILGGIFSLFAIAYFIISVSYIGFGLYNLVYGSIDVAKGFFLALVTFALPILLFSSLLAYGLWNHKRWGRYLVILLSLTFLVYGIAEGISKYGPLNRFPPMVIGATLIAPGIIMVFFMFPSVRKIMTN